jgi:hypothetical protein
MANEGIVAPAIGLLMAGFGFVAYAEAGTIPIALVDQALPNSSMTLASFWGEPFPFGYRYQRRQCIRYLLIDTPHGPRWTKILVCH